MVLLLLNIVGKQIKNDYIEEYQFRKVVESFFRMKPAKYHKDHIFDLSDLEDSVICSDTFTKKDYP